MSTAFTDFLREQAAQHDAEVQAGRATADEWRAAVIQLFERIRSWLTQSDPNGVIQIEESQHEVTEKGLGRYRVPRLNLCAFGKWIGIIPKARNTIASAQPPQRSAPERATGRVDITDEVRRYVLYRFRNDGAGDLWMIDDPASKAPPKPLDQQGFAAALVSYLR
jgi:hypothetical protein